jgi:hypothetical protein
MKIDSCFRIFANVFMTTVFTGGISFSTLEFCNWWGCNTWTAIFRTDLVCNACTDVSYSLKNYQTSLYGTMFSVLSYQMTELVNKAVSSIN